MDNVLKKECNTCHIIKPLSEFSNCRHMTLNNIQIVCHSCNSTKRNRTMVEFIEYCKLIVKLYGEK